MKLEGINTNLIRLVKLFLYYYDYGRFKNFTTAKFEKLNMAKLRYLVYEYESSFFDQSYYLNEIKKVIGSNYSDLIEFVYKINEIDEEIKIDNFTEDLDEEVKDFEESDKKDEE